MYCVMAAAVGGFMKALVIAYDFEKPHHQQEEFIIKNISAAFANILSRCLLAGFTGLLFALLMTDAIKFEKGPIAKLLVLAVLIGYLAPELWKSQEKKMLAAISKGVESTIQKTMSRE
jgi:hypothetical protein